MGSIAGLLFLLLGPLRNSGISSTPYVRTIQDLTLCVFEIEFDRLTLRAFQHCF